MPDLSHCLCGDAPTLSVSAHREDARMAMADHLKAVEAKPHSTGQAARDYERSKLAMQVLAPDHADVSCESCGRWVHGDTEEHAANTWNKAIEKLSRLQVCCKEDYERRVDYDGMVLHVCTSPAHDDSIHGRRYLPLDPHESYEPKPSDAGKR